MLYDIALVCCLSTSMCQVGFSNDVVDTFLSMSAGTSKTSGLTCVIHQMTQSLKCCMVHFFSYWSDIFWNIYLDILHS